MKKNVNLISLFLLVILFSGNTFAQDDHNYLTPLGNSLYYKEVQDANRMVLGMNEVKAISAGKDGLTVVFSMQQDLSKVTEPLKLISFTTDTEANSFIDIFYDDATLVSTKKS